MHKDFDKWNKQKKTIHYQIKGLPIFHEREIWWCSLGINVGDEIDGKNQPFERPSLVIKKFSKTTAWVLPMSRKIKANIYCHSYSDGGKMVSVRLSQLRLVSAKRFRRFSRKLGRSEYNLIINKLIRILK